MHEKICAQDFLRTYNYIRVNNYFFMIWNWKLSAKGILAVEM